MNQHHQEILEEIKMVARSNPNISSRFDPGRYMGTSKPCINITNPQTREILKKWVKEHKDISLDELLFLLDSTFAGKSHTERSLGGKLLEYLPKQRQEIDPACLDKWLIGAEGWGEVDSLCQSSFEAKEILAKWEEWEKFLKKFVGDKDIHKRRASLVLLTGPVRQSDDTRFSDLAFKNIEKLKGEKDILITKAISWVLRSLIKNYKSRVMEYLKRSGSTLPKIALKETTKKLLTGKK